MSERVAMTVLMEGSKLLLEKRRERTPTGVRTRYAFVGGSIEDGESEAEAAARELKEELGLDILPSILGEPRKFRRHGFQGFVFRAAIESGEVAERINVVRFTPEELISRSKKLMPFTRAYVEEHFREWL